ncbi:hypothetical protein ACT2CV_08070 [Pasteurellaceae bacterium 22721_9_1]
MPKYVARLYCVVEVTVEAESIEQAMRQCDLNDTELNSLPHNICEVDDVIELEEL